MENKKTITAITILIIIIVAVIGIIIYVNKFKQNQLKMLTEESNKLLQQNLIENEINEEIKTAKDYAKVEKTIKEYLIDVKNIYVKIQELQDDINSEKIFSVDKLKNHNLEDIDKEIEEKRNKSKKYLEECKEKIEEKAIMEVIESVEFSSKEEYYIELYKSVMLSDSMKIQLSNMEEKIEKCKDDLYDKLTITSNIKQFLKENSKYWFIKNDKIVFTSNNVIVQYYDLINKLNS